jgi:hypothetical protein
VDCTHVRWVPDALQFWREAANILKQPTRGGPPAWGLGMGLTTPHHKKKLVTKILKKPRTWTDSLDKRPRQKKMDMRCSIRKVRSMYRAWSLRAVAKEISKYNLDLVGVQEVRWNRGGNEPAGEYKFFYGKGNENHELRMGFFCT